MSAVTAAGTPKKLGWSFPARTVSLRTEPPLKTAVFYSDDLAVTNLLY
jgi:hypothetical protein